MWTNKAAPQANPPAWGQVPESLQVHDMYMGWILVGEKSTTHQVEQIHAGATTHHLALHSLSYKSQSHPNRTWGPPACRVSNVASSWLTSRSFVSRPIMSEVTSGSNVCSAPVMGTCRSDAMSSSVIVNSPTGKLNVLVLRCHLSTKADMSPRSVVITEHLISGLNPVAAIMPSISGTSLPILSTFLPWETNFRLGRS